MSSVDVIVPCYRYGHFLRQCVESVLHQAGPSVRVLILDDASPDDSADVASRLAREDPRVELVKHAVNKGHIATYNEGIEWTSAKYLLLLSADDYLLPGALARSVGVMEDHPEVGFVFGNVIERQADGTERQVRPLANYRNQVERQVFTGPQYIELSGATNPVSTPSAVVRTALQKQVGGYLPELPHSGDMEMWLRLAARASVGFVDDYQAVYRQHGNNMSVSYFSRNWLGDIRQRKAALDCFFESSSSCLSDPVGLRRTVYYSLACESLRFASSAFNDRQFDASGELSDFAAAISPETKQTWAWKKLACKRRMGSRAWGAIQAAMIARARWREKPPSDVRSSSRATGSVL